MTNTIERLEKFAEAWPKFSHSGDHIYGIRGHGVEADLSVSDLVALLKAARQLYAAPCISGGKFRCWEASDEGWMSREDWCAPCVALEPLFREVPS